MMHDAGFERLEELFHAALALPEGERAAFLRRECGGDEAMRQELEEMLRLTVEPDTLLDVSVLEQLGRDEFTGGMAGRWSVGERVGEGGLGVVHQATDEKTGERGAIKFLRPGFDAGAFRRRFLRERRILGELAHPHIARWLDGGVDGAGRPYLVMEFVDGEPLDHYLTATKPGGTARLALLKQVCEAVQYLHGELVAHGDLKPSNVLVGSDGKVKLVDFGAARLLSPTDSGEAATTMTRAFLTPHYASPEQRQGDGPSVSSDIFAMGVILGEAFPAADADMRAIRDLCCRPEAEARYRSVLELHQDLERYGAKRPVRARRQDRWYRAGKFLRRNGVAVGTAGALLAAALTGGFFFWREFRQEQERLGQMRQVVRSVLNNAGTQVVSGGEDRRAMRQMMERAIAELEGAGGRGMELELAAAWRRLGAARIEDGETDSGLEALEKAYGLAEGVWKTTGDKQAFASKAITLPLWALTQQTRRPGPETMALTARAVELHVEYKKLFGQALPPQSAYYRLMLGAGPIVARGGEKERGRAMLMEALGAAREGKSAEYTARALLELAEIGGKDEAAEYCEEAARVDPLAARLEAVCGKMVPVGVQIAGLQTRIAAREEELRHDPERFQTVRRVARLRVQLARMLGEQGRLEEARAEYRKGMRALESLAKRDPEHGPLRDQVEQVRQAMEQLAK